MSQLDPKNKAVLPNGDIVEVIEIPRHLHVLCSTDDQGVQTLHSQKGDTVRLHMVEVSVLPGACKGCWFESESHGCTAPKSFLGNHPCETVFDCDWEDAVRWFIFKEIPVEAVKS